MVVFKRNLTVLIIIFISIIFVGGGIYMYQSQYQMSILITPDREDDPEWPSKQIWFDASKWLNMPQYIKIDDFYILNAKYHPVDFKTNFNVMETLKFAIQEAGSSFPDLIKLSQMNNDDFSTFMENKLSYEYLRSKFNINTLEPTDDYFLFYFSYNEKAYEVKLLRKATKYGLIFVPYGYKVNKKGYWHTVEPAAYSYQDYINGKILK
ncbi:hypothetical protein MQY53_004567 [Salmonella enterica subsp. enterica]|nr:hypothetical protein [Salmonella enterica subsp. enterica]